MISSRVKNFCIFLSLTPKTITHIPKTSLYYVLNHSLTDFTPVPTNHVEPKLIFASAACTFAIVLFDPDLDSYPSSQEPKPNFARPATSDLKSRLQTFLPQMAAANAELEKLAQEGGLEGKRLEDVGEGDEYVEMELGLGVMEEKKEGDDSSDETSDESSDDSSEDSSEEDDDDDEKEQKKKQKEKEQKEKDILGRLMGHKQGREKAAGIQEVE
ncbi:unnamed protein product [Aureobasidium pullulans]|nr:unnamed protein product [Aureobasidium pullulans]